MILKSNFLRLLLVGFASAGLLAACGGSDDNDDSLDVNDPNIRFVHAVPGGPSVTLQRNGVDDTAATNVGYKYASEYYDVDTETYTYSLRTAPAGGGTELDSISVDAERGNRYTIVALPADSGAELVQIVDPYDKRPGTDDSRVRVLSVAANAQAFDVYLTADPAVDLTNESPDITNVGYKTVKPDSGSNSFDEIEPGTYRLRLTPTGSKTAFFNQVVTLPDDGDWLLVALPEDPATPNSVRLLLVNGNDSDSVTEEIVTE
jgi:hypothetical protein